MAKIKIGNDTKVSGTVDVAEDVNVAGTTTSTNIVIPDAVNKILLTDKDGKIVPSDIQIEELNRLDGISINVQSKFDTLDSDISKEKEERESNDTSIRSAINVETVARKSADTTLQSNIDKVQSELNQEIQDRITSGSDLSDKITAEQNARISADTTLQSNIDSEAKTRKSADDTLTSNLNSEIANRKSADDILQNNIDSEADTRSKSDTTLQGNIDNEATARATADETLQSNIDTEESERKSALSTVTTTLNNEISARKSSDETITANLNQEIEDRESGDSTLQTNLNTEISDRKTAVSTVTTNLNNEISARKSADSTLTTNLATEVSDRKSADETLQSNIDSEADTRSSADETLQSNIDSEVTSRKSAVTTVTNSLNSHTSNKSNPHSVTKAQVGLGSVVNAGMDNSPTENSSNYVKSSGVYSSINSVSTSLDSHTSNKSNPHEVTKAQVGLGNVDNTSDVDKPISTATQSALNLKVDKTTTVNGHALSSNVTVSKSDVGLSNVDNTSDMNKPVSTAQKSAIDTVQTNLTNHSNTTANASTKGHVKFDTAIGTSDRTDVTISEKGIKDYVNSSIATATADFLGTYNAVSDLGIAQATVDTYTYNPTSDVETTVAGKIKTTLTVTPTANDYVFISVNHSTTTDIDFYWRFKYDGASWLYEYTLNNSSFTQAQWNSINSGITSSKVSKLDGISDGAEVNVQADWNVTDTTSDAYIKNKPTIPTVSVSQTGSGYVSDIAVDTSNKHQLNVTRTAIPSVAVTNGSAESGKYVSAVATNGHGISITKASLPTLSKGTTSGTGNVVTEVSVSGHTVTLTKGITALTSHQDISGKANTNLNNISGLSTTYSGKVLAVSSTGGLDYIESGKIDDVKVNGTSVLSNRVATVTVPTKVSQLTNDSKYITGITFANVSSKPTTIAGYGITDAKISNGVITLGTSTITPITDISSKVDKTTTINGHALSTNVTLVPGDIFTITDTAVSWDE